MFQTYHFMKNFNFKQINFKTSNTSMSSRVNPKYNYLGIDDKIINLS